MKEFTINRDATEAQRDREARFKGWYIDMTFRQVCRELGIIEWEGAVCSPLECIAEAQARAARDKRDRQRWGSLRQ